MESQTALFLDRKLSNLKELVDASNCEAWIVDASKFEGTDENLIEQLKLINKRIILKTNRLEVIKAIKPYCVYVNTELENIYETLKSAQDSNSKLMVGLIVKDKSAKDIRGVVDSILRFNSTPLFLIYSECGTWSFLDKFEDIINQSICMDCPPCIGDLHGFRYSSKFFEVKEVIIDGKYTRYNWISDFRKLKSHKGCKFWDKCYGSKMVYDEKLPTDRNPSGYASISDTLSDRPDVSNGILNFDPANWENEFGNTLIDILQRNRVEHHMEGRNFYYVYDFKTSVFFNRPMEPTQVWKWDDRGAWSMNWQFIAKDDPSLAWKQKCDCLLPHNGFATAVKVKFTKEWTDEKRYKLNNLTLSVLADCIIELGADPNKIKFVSNDILYDGKKFCGKEWSFVPSYGYIENTTVTCSYEKEKYFFDQLYHHDKERPITGITDEVPTCTKEKLIELFYSRIKKFFSTFNIE